MRGGGRSKFLSEGAFTLAEVLITLGIIGIVATMTLPSLVNKYQAKVLETGFKKSYANLQNAYMLTKASLGVTNLVEEYAYVLPNGICPNKESFENEFIKNVKAIKNVEVYPFKTYSGKLVTSISHNSDLPQALNILPDGSSIGNLIKANRIEFWVDTNGPSKGPNRYGFDIFYFRVDDKSDKVKPIKPVRKYTEEELENEKWPALAGYPCDNTSTQELNGIGCSWFAMNDINPDDESKSYWANLPK